MIFSFASKLGIALCLLSVLRSGSCNDDYCYYAKFSENAKACSGFENKILDATSLALGGGDDDEATLNGVIKVSEDMSDKFQVKLEIEKEMEQGGKDPVYNVVGDICKSMGDDSTPWYSVFEAMNVTSCPILMADYEVKKIGVNLEFANDFLTHDFVGSYTIILKISEPMEDIACYELEIAIIEEEKSGDEC